MSWIISEALMMDYANWRCSLGLVEESSAEDCSAGEPSARSSSSRTQRLFCAPDRMTEFSRLSRYGMMCEPSTDDRGEELLMWYLEGFRAKTSAAPEKERELTESEADSGERWPASLARYDRDSHSWKTHQCSLFGDCGEFSATWPKWGTTRAGALYPLQTPERLTCENESGLWPSTPTCNGGHRSELFAVGRLPTPEEFVRSWPTPQAHKITESGEIVNADGTPWDGTGKPHSAATGRPITTALVDAVRMFPTPNASEGKGGGQSRAKRAAGGHQVRLRDAIHYPTPTVNDAKNATLPPSQINHDNIPGALLRDCEAPGGQLNPTWVEWLMGWPLGWTDLRPLETGRFQAWLRSHGASCPDSEEA